MATKPDTLTEALIDRAALGDDTAQAQLWRRHVARLRRVVARRLDPRVAPRLDPSDVVQDVLAEAARKLPTYAASRPLPFYPWLRRIALERLIDLHRQHVVAQRRSVRREAIPDPTAGFAPAGPVSPGDGPLTHALGVERKAEVERMLAALPPADQQLLRLRHLEQLSVREIAARLGIREGAVKTRHLRALRRLRALVSPPDSEASQ